MQHKLISNVLCAVHDAAVEHTTWPCALRRVAFVMDLVGVNVCIDFNGTTIVLRSAADEERHRLVSMAAIAAEPTGSEGNLCFPAPVADVVRLSDRHGDAYVTTRVLHVKEAERVTVELRHAQKELHHSEWQPEIFAHLARALSAFLRDLDRREMLRRLKEEADCLPFGRFVVTGSRQILYANRAGQAMVAAADGLEVLEGRLTPRRPQDQCALSHALQSTTVKAGAPAVVGILRPSRRWPYAARVSRRQASPTERAYSRFDEFDIVVLECSPDTLSIDLISAHGAKLTATEERVLLGIVSGHTLDGVAQQLGIVRGTAKLHLSRVMKKLGVHRQTELLQRMVAPFACTLPESSRATVDDEGIEAAWSAR